MTFIIQIAILAFLKKEVSVMVVCCSFLYAGVFALSATGSFEDAPYGMQRVLSSVPGVKVSAQADEDTTQSSAIRIRMWKNALDPRTGMIRDYIWGDGFQTSLASISRDNVARMRKGHLDQQEYMERRGSWHNGWITIIHRMGIMGLILIHVYYIVAFVCFFRVSRVLLKVKDGIYAYCSITGFLPLAFGSSFMVYTLVDHFRAVTSIALMKLLFCLLQEHALLPPLFSNRQYVPMIIREQAAGAH